MKYYQMPLSAVTALYHFEPRKEREPNPSKVKELLEQGAQPDFVVPRLERNTRQR